MLFHFIMYYFSQRHGNTLFSSILYNLFVFSWLTSAHIVLLGSKTYISGSRIFFDIVCHSQQQWNKHILAWHFSERHYQLTETFILFCQPWQINYTQFEWKTLSLAWNFYIILSTSLLANKLHSGKILTLI